MSAVDRLAATVADPELDHALDCVENDPTSVGPDAVTIADLDRADRALRRLAAIEARRTEIDALYEARLLELDAWREAEHRRLDHPAQWLLARLRAFHEARLAEDPRAKTVHLPAGELRARRGQPRWEFTDETFIAWAEANERWELLRPKVMIERSAAKKAFADQVTGIEDTGTAGRVVTDDGEVVPGVVVFPAEVKFTATPGRPL